MKDMYSPTGWENALPAPATDRTGCTAGIDEECTRRGCGTNCPASRTQAVESVAWDNNENLLELIDNFAETRHTCGHWTYNLKSNETRQKVITALKGE